MSSGKNKGSSRTKQKQLLLQRPEPVLQLTAADDVSWPGAQRSNDAADRGWLVERMSRVLGLRANAPGGVVLADGEKAIGAVPLNEDDIEYDDEPEVYKGPDLLSALPLPLKARLIILYLPPSSFAALASTCKTWHELSIGPDSMWKDKLVLLDYQWPDLNLPPDGITQYYAMGGTDPIAWARRYFNVQSTANKVSAATMEVLKSDGFRPRAFPIVTDDGFWDLLPGESSGSPFPSVALCRAITQFEIKGTKCLYPGVYLIRWRVRTAKGQNGPINVSADATTAVLQKRAARAAKTATTAAGVAAASAATALAITTGGAAGPVVLGTAAVAVLMSTTSVIAGATHQAILTMPDIPAVLLPAPNRLTHGLNCSFADMEGIAALHGEELSTVFSRRSRLLQMSDPTNRISATWRLDQESDLTGWRYVNVSVIHVARPVTVNVSMWQQSAGKISNIAVDYCEFVPLHDDVFRMETKFEPVDYSQPALVEYQVHDVTK